MQRTRPKDHERPPDDWEMSERARAYANEALDRCAELLYCRSPSAAVKAAETLLDRAYGKAPQKVEVQKVVAQLDVAQLAALAQQVIAKREAEGALPPVGGRTAAGGVGGDDRVPPEKPSTPQEVQSIECIDAEFEKEEVDTQGKSVRKPRKRKRKT